MNILFLSISAMPPLTEHGISLDLIRQKREIGRQQGRRHQYAAGIELGKQFFHGLCPFSEIFRIR